MYPHPPPFIPNGIIRPQMPNPVQTIQPMVPNFSNARPGMMND